MTEPYSTYAPFETRAIELVRDGGLMTSSAFVPGTTTLRITYRQHPKDLQYEFDFDSSMTTEEFYEQVVNRLEVASAIDEI